MNITENMALTMLMFALAATRVSHIIAKEDGPFQVFARMRSLCNDRASCGVLWGLLADIVTCVNCLSVWVGMATAWLLAALCWYQDWSAAEIIVCGFAFSTVAVYLDR